MKHLHTIDEIKHAVDSGHTVKCGSPSYTVIKGVSDYFISCDFNDYCIGLHGMEGTKYADRLNGSGFYIQERAA